MMRLMEKTEKKPLWKKIAGVLLIIIGVLALITPFTPGAWLAFIGFELIGVRLLAWDRVKNWLLNRKAVKSEKASENNTDDTVA